MISASSSFCWVDRSCDGLYCTHHWNYFSISIHELIQRDETPVSTCEQWATLFTAIVCTEYVHRSCQMLVSCTAMKTPYGCCRSTGRTLGIPYPVLHWYSRSVIRFQISKQDRMPYTIVLKQHVPFTVAGGESDVHQKQLLYSCVFCDVSQETQL